jgi:2'-5' RNA ligase
MRLFAALPVTGEAEGELRTLLARYRGMDWPVKWVRDEGLHVTVRFLGEVAEGRAPQVRERLRAAVAGTPPLSFSATELGAFPTLSRARVLWAGYESEPALELLVHSVEQAMTRLGFPGEAKTFRPHVTLGRIRDGARLPREGFGALAEERLAGGFVAERLVLYESRTGAGGSRYLNLDSFPLAR